MAKSDKEKELESLLSEVRKEIVGLLKTEGEELSKAHPGEDTSAEVPADESSTAPDGGSDSASEGSAPASAPPADASASAPADASASAPPADASPADASAAPADASAPADGSGDPAADQSMDPAALQAEYAKLDVETLKLHYLACKEALFAAMGGAGADASASAPSAGAAPPPAPAPEASAPPAPAPDAPPALKSEIKPDPKTTGDMSKVKEGDKVEKSERDVEIDSLKAQLAKAESTIEKVVGFVEKVVSAPARKAVTSVADLTNGNEKRDAKSLSKAEISTRLKRAAEKPSLAKSDRELITRFDLGHISVEKVAHLLEL